MNPISTEVLTKILSHQNGVIDINEDSYYEFKSIFDWESAKGKYSKSIAGLNNNNGGYIFFGIEDKTNRIIGVEGFDDIDISTVSSFFKTHFSHIADIKKRSIIVDGKNIGVLFVEKCANLPCISLSAKHDLKDGAIYFRYPGMTDLIDGKNLLHLLHGLKGNSNKDLLDFHKEERKRNLRPDLHIFDYTRMGDDCDFQIGNSGEKALIKDFCSLSEGYNFMFYNIDRLLEKRIRFPVYGRSKFRNSGLGPTGSFEILFTDQIETRYRQIFTIRNGTWDRSEAVEI